MQKVDFTETNLAQHAIEGPRRGTLEIEGPRRLALETESRAKNAARLSDEGEGYLKFGRHPQICLADDGMNEEIFKELAEVKSGFIDFESRCEKLKKSHAELKKSHAELKKSHAERKKGHAELKKSQEELKKSHSDLKKRQEELKKSQEESRESNRALSKVLEGASFLEVALSRLMY